MSLKKLGKYEIIERIGEGATAEVFLANDPLMDRKVALKVLKAALVADSSSFARFAQEAQAASGLIHKNIATVLDMGEYEGRYYIVMRYIPGMSLAKRIVDQGPLSWEQVKKLASQIGSALNYAHHEGFLHRDVKPQNIICTPDGNFVLTDFGLMKAMMQTGLTSHTGAILGTPSYIAPEIWQSGEAGPATDQYSFACVLYEAIMGNILFNGDTPAAIMRNSLLKEPEFPDQWPQGVPQGVGGVLAKALMMDPKSRYEDIETFYHALENAHLKGPERIPSTGRSSDQTVTIKKEKHLQDPKKKKRLVITYGLLSIFSFLCLAVVIAILGTKLKSGVMGLIAKESVSTMENNSTTSSAPFATNQSTKLTGTTIGLMNTRVTAESSDNSLSEISANTPTITASETVTLTPTRAHTPTSVHTATSVRTPTKAHTPTRAHTATITSTPTSTLNPEKMPAFTDEFELSVDPRWEYYEEDWLLVDGAITSLISGRKTMLVGDTSWDSYSINIDFHEKCKSVGAGSQYMGVVLRAQNPNEYIMLKINTCAIYVGVYLKWLVYKSGSVEYETDYFKPEDISSDGQVIHVRIEVENSVQRVYINNLLTNEMTYPQFPETGMVGLVMDSKQDYYVERFEVSPLK